MRLKDVDGLRRDADSRFEARGIRKPEKVARNEEPMLVKEEECDGKKPSIDNKRSTE